MPSSRVTSNKYPDRYRNVSDRSIFSDPCLICKGHFNIAYPTFTLKVLIRSILNYKNTPKLITN